MNTYYSNMIQYLFIYFTAITNIEKTPLFNTNLTLKNIIKDVGVLFDTRLYLLALMFIIFVINLL